ncbi:MAG: cytochrome c biogenesis protein CcsA [Gemmataceae bacterium]
MFDQTQPLEIDGHKYEVSLRFKRIYKPHTVFLKSFRFDRYMGTNMAMNFSSDVLVVDPERQAERAAHISMNDPLRYRGEAYFQADYDKNTEKTTILQVVRNPGWLIPYFSCFIVTLGMIVHFANTLPKQAKKIQMPWVQDSKRDRIWIAAAWVIVAVVGMGALAPLFVTPKPFNFTEAGRIPVLERGRIKPLETLARVNLRMISGQESIDYKQADGTKERVSAVKWFFDVASGGDLEHNGVALKYPIFKVDNEQVQNELSLKNREGQRYSLEELVPKISTIFRRAKEANAKKETERDLTEQKFFELAERIQNYMRILNLSAALMIPPRTEGGEWQNLEKVTEEINAKAYELAQAKLKLTPEEIQNPSTLSPERKQQIRDTLAESLKLASADNPVFSTINEMVELYRSNKPDEFNSLVTKFRENEFNFIPKSTKTKIYVETIFERIAPFYWCVGLYVVAFAITLIGLCGGPAGFQRASFRILLATFIFHSVALIVRIILQGRPPVTNLYSSAIFIGWASVGIGLLFEWKFRGGFANFAGSILGALTTIVAHNVLGTGSDTMEMLQAVLDTNFWLATHVICITLGYVATYFAGFLAVIYALRRFVAGWGAHDRLGRSGTRSATMTYIVLCVAMTLSFLGTVLGGIWADQSWGRFWGWDPKENGAVLIVIWNALILHARWGGMVKGRLASPCATAIVGPWSRPGAGSARISWESDSMPTVSAPTSPSAAPTPGVPWVRLPDRIRQKISCQP